MTTTVPTGLTWGIKQSFLEYIGRMPDGRGTVADGATPNEYGEMTFEPTTADGPGDADLFLPFRGDVRFGGHYGMLFVRIADPWIVVRGGEGELTVLDPYKPDEEPRLRLVTFTLSEAKEAEGHLVWTALDVTLTDEGRGLFNDVYPAGEPFDPISIVLPA